MTLWRISWRVTERYTSIELVDTESRKAYNLEYWDKRILHYSSYRSSIFKELFYIINGILSLTWIVQLSPRWLVHASRDLRYTWRWLSTQKVGYPTGTLQKKGGKNTGNKSISWPSWFAYTYVARILRKLTKKLAKCFQLTRVWSLSFPYGLHAHITHSL